MRKVVSLGLGLLLLSPAAVYAGSANVNEAATQKDNTQAEEAVTNAITLNDTIQWALEYNPRYKILQYNQEAAQHDVDAAKGGYFPTIDLDVSFGVDNHSSTTTRSDDADPSDSDWDARTDAGIVLRQLLWDGGETGSQVDIQDARLMTATYKTKDTAESIALEAMIAHLSVVRQQRLIELAVNNIKDHEEILAHLEKGLGSGAGNQADVYQTKARIERALAAKRQLEADLISSKAQYKRLVGKEPGNLRFASLPASTPDDLETSLNSALNGSPKLLAFGEEVNQYKAQYDLTKAANYPKFFAELSTRYKDQVEGNPSWENTNAAYIAMDWNLYRGGSDTAKKYAAQARIRKSVEVLQNEILDVTEKVCKNWATLEAATERIEIYKRNNDFNEKTLDAYIEQFKLGERSLLDLLSAENDLFQSEGLLVTSQINELIAAGKILALSGGLVSTRYPDVVLPPLEPRAAKIKTQ